MGGLCPRCRGRGWCGRDTCVWSRVTARVRERLKGDVEGYVRTAHVTWRGYPEVYAAPGLGSPVPDEADALADLDFERVVEVSGTTLRKGERRHARREPYDLSHPDVEAAVSCRPVEGTLEVERTISGPESSPFVGPLVKGELEIDGTPRVPRPLEKLHEDDVKAREAVVELVLRRGLDENLVARALSLGLLGLDRRLVPTRWAVAAVDSMVSEHLLREVADLPPADDWKVLRGELYGNEMWVLAGPGPYSLKLIEVYVPGAPWSSEEVTVLEDSEGPGRPLREPEETGGAFLAVRTAVLESMVGEGRSRSVTVIRVVKPEYPIPLGAWVIREAVRRAEEVGRFEDGEEVLGFLSERLKGPARAALDRVDVGRQLTLDSFLY